MFKKLFLLLSVGLFSQFSIGCADLYNKVMLTQLSSDGLNQVISKYKPVFQAIVPGIVVHDQDYWHMTLNSVLQDFDETTILDVLYLVKNPSSSGIGGKSVRGIKFDQTNQFFIFKKVLDNAMPGFESPAVKPKVKIKYGNASQEALLKDYKKVYEYLQKSNISVEAQSRLDLIKDLKFEITGVEIFDGVAKPGRHGVPSYKDKHLVLKLSAELSHIDKEEQRLFLQSQVLRATPHISIAKFPTKGMTPEDLEALDKKLTKLIQYLSVRVIPKHQIELDFDQIKVEDSRATKVISSCFYDAIGKSYSHQVMAY